MNKWKSSGTKKKVSTSKINTSSANTENTTGFDETSFHTWVTRHADELVSTACHETSLSAQMFLSSSLRNWVLKYHNELRIFSHTAFLPKSHTILVLDSPPSPPVKQYKKNSKSASVIPTLKCACVLNSGSYLKGFSQGLKEWDSLRRWYIHT